MIKKCRISLKKIIVLFIFQLVFISSIFVSIAASYASTQDRAEVLNIMGILKGDGKDFNLDGTLNRSEATAFVVRLLGQEIEILTNGDYYVTSKFPDIDLEAWYAPYVGYCSSINIVSGYTDGNFGPKDNLSEKAFLKMVLTSLGYVYNDDFTWDNIYSTAYDIGLVTDAEYYIKTEDNLSLTRGEVVNIIYNALAVKNDIVTTTLIQKLIDEGVVNKDIASAFGFEFKFDTLEASIENVTSSDTHEVSITINESLEELSSENIVIFEKDNPSENLDFEISSQEDNVLTLDTARQTPGTKYIINLIDVTDLENNVYSLLESEFSGYKAKEVESDFFKIKKVEPISSSTLYVYFTQPINDNSLQPNYYSILESGDSILDGNVRNMSIGKIPSVNNGVMIFLKDDILTDSREYQLSISGILTSSYGVKLNEGQDEVIDFYTTTSDEKDLKLKKISTLSKNVLQLEFNKYMNPVLAKQKFNFYITDSEETAIPISSSSISGFDDDRGKFILIKTDDEFEDSTKYNVMINNITDISRQYSITEKEFSFTADYKTTAKYKIESIEQIDAGTINIYFTTQLDPESALKKSYYTIERSKDIYNENPYKVYYAPEDNPYMVTLFLPENKNLETSKTYNVVVSSNLKDYTGNTLSKDISSSFKSSKSKTVKPFIEEAVIISNDTIKLTFNKELALNITNILTSNYALECTDNGVSFNKVPLSVNYIDPKTIILKFDNLDFSLDYNISFNELIDYTENNKSTSSDEESVIEVKLGE